MSDQQRIAAVKTDAERIAEQMTISGNPNLRYFGVKRIQFPLA